MRLNLQLGVSSELADKVGERLTLRGGFSTGICGAIEVLVVRVHLFSRISAASSAITNEGSRSTFSLGLSRRHTGNSLVLFQRGTLIVYMNLDQMAILALTARPPFRFVLCCFAFLSQSLRLLHAGLHAVNGPALCCFPLEAGRDALHLSSGFRA